MSRTPGQVAADILLNPPVLIANGVALYMLFSVLRAATARNPQAVDGVTADGGRLIPLKATFAGVKGFPELFAIATNSASPLLIIRDEGIEYRVIRKHKRAFSDIEQVHVHTAWKTVNITIQFRGDVLTFAANVGNVVAAQAALALFPASVPMTARALAIRGEVPQSA
jgi:hypothetical protein